MNGRGKPGRGGTHGREHVRSSKINLWDLRNAGGMKRI